MRRLLPAVVLFLSAPATLLAQSITGSINGTITDSSEPTLPNAAIIVTNTATGVVQQVKTDSARAYRVGQLQPGNYTIKVTSSGFQDQTLQNINLVVDRQDVNLGVSGGNETVTVESGAQLLKTIQSSQGQVISNKQIVELPLNGRDFLQLAQLSAGVTPSNVNGMNSPPSAWTARRR